MGTGLADTAFKFGASLALTIWGEIGGRVRRATGDRLSGKTGQRPIAAAELGGFFKGRWDCDRYPCGGNVAGGMGLARMALRVMV
jgi:hypothetical protein